MELAFEALSPHRGNLGHRGVRRSRHQVAVIRAETSVSDKAMRTMIYGADETRRRRTTTDSAAFSRVIIPGMSWVILIHARGARRG